MFKQILFLLASLSLVVGCNSGVHSNQPVINSTLQAHESQIETPLALTIDNSATIPVFNHEPTIARLTVRNNTSSTISQISYLSISSNNKNGKLLNSSECSSIAGNSSCILEFMTPEMKPSENASSLITAHYPLAAKNQEFSQIINYKWQANTDLAINSDVSLNGYGTDTGYATIYIYGRLAHSVYKVSADKPAFSLQLESSQSLQVIPVQVKSSLFSSLLTGKVSVFADDGNTQVRAENTLLSATKDNPSDLMVSTPDYSMDSKLALFNEQTLFIQNRGLSNLSEPLQLIRHQFRLAMTVSASDCPEMLNPGYACSVKIRDLNHHANNSIFKNRLNIQKTATRDIPSDGLSSYTPLIDISLSESGMVHLYGDVNKLVTLTLTNRGTESLYWISIPKPQVVSGNVSVNIEYDGCTSESGIGTEQSCQIVYSLIDNNIEDINRADLQINFFITGFYSDTTRKVYQYNRVIPVMYALASDTAQISTSVSNPDIQITGDGKESLEFIIKITNNGNTPAKPFMTFFDTQLPEYLRSSSDCPNSLAPFGSLGDSCNIRMRLGQYLSYTQINDILKLSLMYRDFTFPSESTGYGRVSASIAYRILPLPKIQYLPSPNVSATASVSALAIASNLQDKLCVAYEDSANLAQIPVKCYDGNGWSDLPMVNYLTQYQLDGQLKYPEQKRSQLQLEFNRSVTTKPYTTIEPDLYLSFIAHDGNRSIPVVEEKGERDNLWINDSIPRAVSSIGSMSVGLGSYYSTDAYLAYTESKDGIESIVNIYRKPSSSHDFSVYSTESVTIKSNYASIAGLNSGSGLLAFINSAGYLDIRNLSVPTASYGCNATPISTAGVSNPLLPIRLGAGSGFVPKTFVAITNANRINIIAGPSCTWGQINSDNEFPANSTPLKSYLTTLNAADTMDGDFYLLYSIGPDKYAVAVYSARRNPRWQHIALPPSFVKPDLTIGENGIPYVAIVDDGGIKVLKLNVY